MKIAILIAWLAYESAERVASRLLFGDESDIKDWRRRHHPSVSRREWRLFGRWTVCRTREPLQ